MDAGGIKSVTKLALTSRQAQVWDLLSQGRTQRQVAVELDITLGLVNKEINLALNSIRGWAGREAEDWRNHQL